jgi:polar amino acid transport system substrate-binding protein
MFKKLFLLSSLLLANTALCQDKIVKIAICDFPPFEYHQEGKVIGLNADIVNTVFKNIGYKTEISNYPWKRALELSKSGEVDAIMSIRKSPEREIDYVFSDPISLTQNYFFKMKNREIKAENITDLKPYNIGTVKGYVYGKAFDEAKLPNLFDATSNSPELQNLQKLAAGRLDLIACEINVCSYLINSNKDLSNIIAIKEPKIADPENFYIAFSRHEIKKSNDLVTKFNQELAKFLAEGKREDLLNKYKLIDIYK